MRKKSSRPVNTVAPCIVVYVVCAWTCDLLSFHTHAGFLYLPQTNPTMAPSHMQHTLFCGWVGDTCRTCCLAMAGSSFVDSMHVWLYLWWSMAEFHPCLIPYRYETGDRIESVHVHMPERRRIED